MKHIIFTFQVCLMAMMSAFTAQAQTVIPYLPMQSSLGNTISDLNAFTPPLNDFTLEVTGVTNGTEISVGGDYVKYTPTAAGTVRFAQYKGIVYVYENGGYKDTIIPYYSIDYSTANLLENPGFETNSLIVTTTTDRWKDGVNWNVYDESKAENWGTASPNSSIRNGSSYGTYRFLMHSNGRYLTQQLAAGKLKPNTRYKVQYYYAMSQGNGNDGGTYTLELGSTQFGTEYGAITAHTVPNNEAWASFETAFTTGATVDASQPAWFCLHRSNSKVDYLDDIQLYEGTLSIVNGITGASAATFLDGEAKAPEITLSNDDAFDMYPYYLINPNFDANFAGWSYTTNGTMAYSTGVKADGTLLLANDGKLQVWGITNTGNIYQSLSGLPNGKYKIKAAVYAENVVEDGLYLYANRQQTVITNSVQTTNAYIEVSDAIVADGNLEFGIKLTVAGTSLVALDKVSLLYYGPDSLAQAKALLAQIATYRDLFLQPQNAALKADFVADTLAAYDAATAETLVPADLENTAAALATRLLAVNASIAAYQTLGTFLDRVESYTLGYYTGFSGYDTYSAAVTAARTAYTGGTIEDADIPTTIDNLKTAENTCLLSDGATDQTSLITNPTFDTNINGWTSTTGAANNKTASNKYGDFIGSFWENWNGSAFTGKMYQTITNVPNGKYRLKAAVFTTTQKEEHSEWIHLYANASKTPVTTTAPTYHMVDVEVVGGTLEVGIEMSEAISQWVGVDNFTLYRLGDITSTLINVDKNAFSFNYRQTTKQFTVKAVNLTADITFTPPAGITLSPTSISQNTENLGTEGVVVTATFDRSASIIDGNITVTTTGGNTVNITVNADSAYQANLMYGWDANGATGAGSEPNNYGWQSASESVNWNVASTNIVASSTYYRDGSELAESKRALSKYTSSVDVAYPVLLEAGKSYYFSGKWSWVSDGESPYSSTFAVYDNAAGNGDAIASETNTSIKQSVVPSSFGFTATADAVYLVVWKTAQGRCFAWDLSVEDAFKVTFNANGGSETAPQYLPAGGAKKVSEPAIPTKFSHDFAAWFTTPDFAENTEFDFENTEITADITLYARWELVTDPLISVDKNAFSFNYRQTTKQFTVKAINLTADITFTPPAGITLSPESILQNTENLGTEGVVVTAAFDRSASIIDGNIAVTTAGGNTVNIAVTADSAFQANLMYGWDANGATGAGSEPNNYGWQSASESVNWNVASTGNTDTSTYYRDGQTQSENKRALSKYTSSVDVAYPVLLEAGKSYYFSGKWSWVSDGESPYGSTFAVYDNAAGSGDAIASETTSSTEQSVVPSSFGFTASADTVYRVVWKTSQGCCFAWDLSVEDAFKVTFNSNGGSETAPQYLPAGGAKKVSEPAIPSKLNHDFVAWFTTPDFAENTEFDFENTEITADITLYARWELVTNLQNPSAEANKTIISGVQGGINITAKVAENIRIFSVTGQMIHTRNLAAGESAFVALLKGIYIVNGQKAVVE